MTNDAITFIGSPNTAGSKAWTGEDVKPYATGPGPFHTKRIPVASLDDVAGLVSQCPPNAFVVRGAAAETVIPYRRHRDRDGEPATLTAEAHRWLAVDVDRAGPDPRTDLPAMAQEAREALPACFRAARAFAVATSSAGIVPGVRVRLWYWCDRPVSDGEAAALLADTDTSIFTPSQPHYCAPPTFSGRPDPFAGVSRTCWLDGAPEVAIPAAPEVDPLASFGRSAAGAAPGNRNVNLTSLAGTMRRRGLGEDAILAALAVHNAALPEPLPTAEVAGIARSVARYAPDVAEVGVAPTPGAAAPSPVAIEKAEKALRKVCARLTADPEHWKDHVAALGKHLPALPGDLARVRVERAIAEGGTVVAADEIATVLDAAILPAERPAAWAERAIVNDDGNLVPCPENLSLLLRGHPDFALWLNTRTGRAVWDRCPWRPAGAVVADGDDFQLRCWVSRMLGWHSMPGDPLAAFAEVAAARAWDPWRGWLESLVWDGTLRLESAPMRLLGATDTPAHRAVFAWWLISAVARSYAPGAQVDHMLVLEGPQGAGKTTFLRELAMSEAFFTRLKSSVDLEGVRTIGKIHGPVIVEIAELSTVRKATVEAVKAFIDERIDRVQWLYARSTTDVPRTCVFAGTANDREYLRDVTGNRRFWPLEVGTIDLDGLRAEREQLWAEAVAAYRAGARWWPTAEETAALGLEALQDDRRVASSAEEGVGLALEGSYRAGMHMSGAQLHGEQLGPDGRLVWVTLRQLCALAQCKDYEAQLALRVHGWKNDRVRLTTGRLRVYVRGNEGG